MSAAPGGAPVSRQLRHRSPPLHPLEVRPSPRRRYQLALALQLLSTAGILAVATGLLIPTTSPAVPGCGLLLAGGGWAAARRCRQRAWSGLPAPRRRVVMPTTDDRRCTVAAALLLMLWAAAVSPLGPAGGFLAAMIGLDAAIAGVRSVCLLIGQVPDPARRVPALATAAAFSWGAAATVGGLGVRGVLVVTVLVGTVVAAGHALLAVLRWAVRS